MDANAVCIAGVGQIVARQKARVDDTYERLGKRIEDIERGLSGFGGGSLYWTLFFDELRHKSLDPSTVAFIQEGCERANRKTALECSINEIRTCVSIDRTEPIAVRFVGRALRELGARDEATAQSRIQIFAKFAEAPANKVLEALGSRPVDYREVAKECASYVADLRKTGPQGSSGSRVLANNASRSLEKPIERLEQLRLADARLDAKAKRQASYLKQIAVRVFDAWPEWDDK